MNERPKVGVGVFIFNKNNEILLGRRISSHGSNCWAAPGGHLEYGESFEECAIREIQEETGLIISNPTFFFMCNDIFHKEQKHYVTIAMRADLPESQTPQVCEPDKISEWRWFSLNNLPEEKFMTLQQFVNKTIYGPAKTL